MPAPAARRLACLLLCGSLAGIGCSQTATAVRGQSPSMPQYETAAGDVVQTSFGHCPTGTCKPGFGGMGHGLGPGGLPGFGGPGYCPPHGKGDLFQKKHQTVYSYTQPAPLAYPEGTGGPGSPMPVVRYPYYPVKGPDDFFYDKDGKF